MDTPTPTRLLANGTVLDGKGKMMTGPTVPPFTIPAIRQAATAKSHAMRKNRIRQGIIEGTQAGMSPDQIARHGENIDLPTAVQVQAATLTEQIVMEPSAHPSARVKAAEFLLKQSELAVGDKVAGQQAQTINNIIVSDAAMEQITAVLRRKQGNDE